MGLSPSNIPKSRSVRIAPLSAGCPAGECPAHPNHEGGLAALATHQVTLISYGRRTTQIVCKVCAGRVASAALDSGALVIEEGG